MPSQDELKQAAAAEAVAMVNPGMVLGLGAGSTSLWALRLLAVRIAAGELPGVRGVPCAADIAEAARELAVPLTTLEDDPVLDLTIDGADEVDAGLNLIKGGGGALLREKIVAQASRREVIIVDESKLSRRLGEKWAVPVEVLPFGWRSAGLHLEGLGARVVRRGGEEPFVTDQGNYILDCHFGPMGDPGALGRAVRAKAGVIEHGLFVGLAQEVIVAAPGGVRRLTHAA
jgi:ribose 5-phosphate isomerase A